VERRRRCHKADMLHASDPVDWQGPSSEPGYEQAAILLSRKGEPQ
jgi:hypothetical protein